MAKMVRIVRKKDRLREKLNRIVPGIERQMAGDIALGAEEIAALAKRLAPVAEVEPERRPGEYADGIRARRLRDDEIKFKVKGFLGRKNNAQASGSLAWGIFSRWYWRWIEFGTKRGVAARPHMFPANRVLRRRVKSRISRGINKAIKRAVNK